MTLTTTIDWRTSVPRMRMNAISPYFTMFPLEFPGGALARAKLGDWVLDPFCGRGTTLFAARCLGLPSVGIDTNAVAVATARAKLARANADEIVELTRELLDQNSANSPAGEFWQRAYHAETLRNLVSLRRGLLHACRSPQLDVLRGVVLGILHGPLRRGIPTFLSNQMPRTYATKPSGAITYWNRNSLDPPRVDLVDAISRRARYVLADQPVVTGGHVVHGDSRHELRQVDQKFTWVVTSPPYLGMRTYVPDQWLRNWFLGADPEVAYDDPASIRTVDVDHFVAELGEIFAAVADRCVPGARMVVRFGALPSSPCDPSTVIKNSLKRANRSWEVRDIRPAGVPRRGSRQAEQMRAAGTSIEEIDCEAVLV